jgi:hypothetical protein
MGTDEFVSSLREPGVRDKKIGGGRGQAEVFGKIFGTHLPDHVKHVSSNGSREKDRRHDSIVNHPPLELALPMSMAWRIIESNYTQIKDHLRDRLECNKKKSFSS